MTEYIYLGVGSFEGRGSQLIPVTKVGGTRDYGGKHRCNHYANLHRVRANPKHKLHKSLYLPGLELTFVKQWIVQSWEWAEEAAHVALGQYRITDTECFRCDVKTAKAACEAAAKKFAIPDSYVPFRKPEELYTDSILRTKLLEYCAEVFTRAPPMSKHNSYEANVLYTAQRLFDITKAIDQIQKDPKLEQTTRVRGWVDDPKHYREMEELLQRVAMWNGFVDVRKMWG
jgi:hypothetical protein